MLDSFLKPIEPVSNAGTGIFLLKGKKAKRKAVG